MNQKNSIFSLDIVQGQKVKIAYGHYWDSRLPDWQIENICCFSDEHYGPDKSDHFRNFIELAWPESFKPEGKSTWTYWSKRMFDSVYFEMGNVTALMSGGSAGKSFLIAAYAVGWYLYSPDDRAALCASTTVREAKQGRIWGKMLSFFLKLKKENGLQGKYSKKDEAIYWNEEDPSHGLFLKALGNAYAPEVLKGFHPKKGLLAIFDECSDLDPSLNEALPNLLRQKNKKVVAISNATNDLNNVFNQIAEPLEGWENQDPAKFNKLDDSKCWWRTKFGVCHWFDCYKSPAVKSPNRKEISFLVGNQNIAEGIKTYGEMSANFWSQYRGYPLLGAPAEYVLSWGVVQENGAMDKAIWNGYDPVIRVAALDPAFTQGGDSPILRFGNWGTDIHGKKTLDLGGPSFVFEIKPQSKDEFNHELVAEVIKKCGEMGVGPENFALDATSGGGIILAEMFRNMWGVTGSKITSIFSNSSCSEHYIDSTFKIKACDKFQYRFSELAFMARYFIEGGQLKGMDKETISEFCKRKYKEIGKKIRVQNKKEYKKQIGKEKDRSGSPDRSDCLGVMIAMLMDRGWVAQLSDAPQKTPAGYEDIAARLGLTKQEEDTNVLWDSPDNYASNWEEMEDGI
jgi:hypothetical protein